MGTTCKDSLHGTYRCAAESFAQHLWRQAMLNLSFEKPEAAEFGCCGCWHNCGLVTSDSRLNCCQVTTVIRWLLRFILVIFLAWFGPWTQTLSQQIYWFFGCSKVRFSVVSIDPHNHLYVTVVNLSNRMVWSLQQIVWSIKSTCPNFGQRGLCDNAQSRLVCKQGLVFVCILSVIAVDISCKWTRAKPSMVLVIFLKTNCIFPNCSWNCSCSWS